MDIPGEEFAIDNAKRIHSQSSGPRPILVTFKDFQSKMIVLRASGKLKNSRISVSQDYTQRVRDIRRKLKTFMDQAREKGSFSALRYDKLIIDNKLYKLNETESKLDLVRTFPQQGGTRKLYPVFENRNRESNDVDADGESTDTL
ncbi:uncharacterized protein [Haliotis asinina]|uniref:uncharacterized protein n=1 Tax=Haliotis asinina TaxID=109174 RepID=UPI003532004D